MSPALSNLLNMTTSHNGWPVITSGLWPLPAVSGSVKAGPVWVVMNWLAREYARRVEHIERKQSWGYAHRKIGGSTSWSNHASGTAVDFNAPKHPLKTRAEQNFTPTQIRACEGILADAGGVLRWLRGHDPMHWEIAPRVTPAQVDRLATRLLQAALGITVDGHRGPKTDAALRAFQASRGITVDGQDGPKTWAELNKPPAPQPTPQPTPQEDTMALTDHDIDRIADAVWKRLLTVPDGSQVNAGVALAGARNDLRIIRTELGKPIQP